MRYWLYCEPVSDKCIEPVFQILSEKAILGIYWSYWCEQMDRVGKYSEISKERCIEDWVATHWAVEATPESLLRIIDDGCRNASLSKVA